MVSLHSAECRCKGQGYMQVGKDRISLCLEPTRPPMGVAAGRWRADGYPRTREELIRIEIAKTRRAK